MDAQAVEPQARTGQDPGSAAEGPPCREELTDEKLPVTWVASVRRLACGVLLWELSFEGAPRVSMTMLVYETCAQAPADQGCWDPGAGSTCGIVFLAHPRHASACTLLI